MEPSDDACQAGDDGQQSIHVPQADQPDVGIEDALLPQVVHDRIETTRNETVSNQDGSLPIGQREGIKDGLDINFGTSYAYYLKLTEYNNERAMYNVGLLYEYGLGVAADHEKAVEWLTKAADLGFGPAKDVLAQMNNS